MAFYKFHLDVPAPADVVAARVSSAVGKVPGFRETLKRSWKPEPFGAFPFLGKVEGRKFHIFRNTTYNRAFLPQVRGEIVDTSTGSRVNAILYLHPVAVALMLFRLAGVLALWWVAFTALGASYQTIYLEGLFFLILAIQSIHGHKIGMYGPAQEIAQDLLPRPLPGYQ